MRFQVSCAPLLASPISSCWAVLLASFLQSRGRVPVLRVRCRATCPRLHLWRAAPRFRPRLCAVSGQLSVFCSCPAIRPAKWRVSVPFGVMC